MTYEQMKVTDEQERKIQMAYILGGVESSEDYVDDVRQKNLHYFGGGVYLLY